MRVFMQQKRRSIQLIAINLTVTSTYGNKTAARFNTRVGVQ